MSLIKQLIPPQRKFTPASSNENWTRIETLVHGPGAGEDKRSTNSAVFACLYAIASAYPEPPLRIFRQQTGGKAEMLLNSPCQTLLDKPTPNGELSIDEILFWTAWALHLDGNAYWLKVRSGNATRGNVIRLWPISPSIMWPITDKDSNDWISRYGYRKRPNYIEPVPVENVIHFRLGLDDRDMRKGLSPLKNLAREITTDEEADKFVAALLKNYAVPGLVVVPKNDTVIASEDEADRLKAILRKNLSSDRRGNIAVMTGEVDIGQFGFSPKDLDMSILHRIPEERISAVMGVPAIVAGLGAGLDRATYANFKEAREMFTEQKLVPMWRTNARKLCVSLLPDFTSDRNIYIAHDLSDVRTLQEDENQRYERLSIAVARAPFMLVNEARSDIGLDPLEPEEETPPPAHQEEESEEGQPPPEEEETPKIVDLGKWRTKALKSLKRSGYADVSFESEHIPASENQAINDALAACKNVNDVRQIFSLHIQADRTGLLDMIVRELQRANDWMEKTHEPCASV